MNRSRRPLRRIHPTIEHCEICGADLGRRPQPHRRRCAEHLALLALVTDRRAA